ncbi:MAG TPA: hypothetical protein VNA27_08350 [Rubrobacteraceae bacterium]|nr:hypothetical protein [Rubrobacteraceae bacterium]
MDFLSNLMGREDRRQEYRDFTDRYDEGAPYDRISEEEAANRYREVAPNLSEDDYRLSAREAFERMSPEERLEFGRMLREEAQQRGQGEFVDRDHDGQDDRFQDPDYLAGLTSSMHRREPDLMSSLLGSAMGSGGGGLMGGMMGSGMTGGHGASGSGGMLGNPVAKAALAGIAATAAKKVMGGR